LCQNNSIKKNDLNKITTRSCGTSFESNDNIFYLSDVPLQQDFDRLISYPLCIFSSFAKAK
jgi:hypothetical protein